LFIILEVILVHASTAPHSGALAYRPDIDGLRAVAVIAVLLFHCWPARFVSGFVGVDIFFVISGYLITSIILNQLEQGKFSIFDFYSRRVRRIFPALLVVMAATLAFGWVVLLQGEFRQVGKHIAAGGGFVSNLVLWAESGYFDASTNTKPLLHLWSLGVEEQFYIAWPVILWLSFTRKLNFLLLAALIFCASMALNVMTVGTNPTAAFYSPATRFWELMTGGMGAYLHMHHAPWSKGQKTLASWSGVVLMAASFALIKPQTLFPGWWAALPVAATFLLIMAGPAAPVNRLLLSSKPAVGVGLISYPLYLWHWPLLSYTFIIVGEKPHYLLKLALIAATFVLAFLTYRLLERPLGSYRNNARKVGVLAGGMAVMALAGIGVQQGLFKERIDVHGAEIYLNALNDTDFPGPTFTPLKHQGITFQKISANPEHVTVFLGDSMMQQYGPYMEQLLAGDQRRYNSVIFATAGGCPPIRHTIRLPKIRFPLCPQAVNAAYDLASRPEVNTVVIGAGWYNYLSKQNDELQFDTGNAILPFPSADAMERTYAALETDMAELKRQGKRLYLILQPPTGSVFDPRNMYQGSRFDSIQPVPQIEGLDLERFLAANADAHQRLSAIAHRTGATLVEPSAFLCKDNKCPVLDASGAPLYTDAVHMRPAYSRKAAVYLDQTVTAAADTTRTQQ
jgi:peptidoglycan/LPS O-acetylase OafA/YrhL